MHFFRLCGKRSFPPDRGRGSMDGELRRLQLYELEILDEFVRLCDGHGLRYFLVGGSLLGAVRHEGFVPWDDDIDVAMPRRDYERFAALCQTELDGRWFYQSHETDPHYFLSYAKLRRNDSFFYEERFRRSQFHKGISIDIFPLDPCPAPGPVCHLLFNVLAVMNYRGQVDSGEPYVPYKELSGKLGFAVLRLFNARQLPKLRGRLLRLSRRLSRGTHAAIYSGAYGYYKEVFPASWFDTPAKLPFEGKALSVPCGWDGYLHTIYNDYMVPPEEAKRRPAHQLWFRGPDEENK